MKTRAARPAMLPVLLLLFFSFALRAQRPLDQADIHRWRKIEQPKISADGRWVAYVLVPQTEGDPVLCLWNAADTSTRKIQRGTDARFTDDANYLIFRLKQPLDSLKAMRRRKVKDDDLPKDSLGILSLETGQLTKIPKVKSFAVPDKWAGWLAYQLEAEKPPAAKKDTAQGKPSAVNRPPSTVKKENKDNGSRLIIRNLTSGTEDTVAFVKEYVFAEKGPRLLLATTGRDSAFLAGVYLFEAETRQLRPLFRGRGKFQNLAFDKRGRQAAFLADLDTTKARVRPYELGFWTEKKDSAALVGGRWTANGGQDLADWRISEHATPKFSDDGTKLFFGIAPPPVLPDTSLLPEEIVNVEVWAWTDEYLHTQQKARLDDEKKRSYPVVYRIRDKKFVPLGSEDLPEIRFTRSRDAELAVAWTEKPYAQELIWDGEAHRDVYALNLKTGDKTLIAKNLRGNPQLSPSGKFVFWFSEPDSAWFAWNARSEKTTRLTDNRTANFFNEETDVPDLPGAHGFAGWLPDDEAFLVYDKFDIWKIDPLGKRRPERLTRGRETATTFRYLKLDPDETFIHPDSEMLLHQFHEPTKAEGYAWFDPDAAVVKPWLGGNYAFSRNPFKARRSWDLVFTRENFETFPDLLFASTGRIQRISHANPQQSEYAWGSIELVTWTALDGQKLTGMLAKPPGFDPRKKYPMLVNFYERSSDGLFQYRGPDAHRSQINYAIYASRGYLIFNPDIPYRIGYPGESAANSILSGVANLIDRGFVDAGRIGIQGHSWGGYQTAYLLTKTNMFACAESGAPVVNMVSAYGGIRWESGRSRIFQYEHQQSRIGGSLWERPLRYLENSPIFSLDKVQTPVLILHNDRDGAVPWYQGIEFFTGLVRLGKPAWLLNYNDEPHWPVKLQNRIDFQIRMQQFFDHYLMSGKKPRWMERGVPALEKGILQGLD
ncbi:MAG: alpha/beta hydrolase family protein [Saprospiraceae bacterium]